MIDGVATKETQKKLKALLAKITEQEIEEVREYCYKLLEKAGRKLGRRYRISFVPVVPLQLMLGNKQEKIQYGVHCGNVIKIVRMDGSKKGLFGEVLILAHETGHALLGHRNDYLRANWGSRVMEKATDEVIKMYLMDKFPLFYKMYYLCRNTHHWDTKEGDYKVFFADIIEGMEKKWKSFLKKQK